VTHASTSLRLPCTIQKRAYRTFTHCPAKISLNNNLISRYRHMINRKQLLAIGFGLALVLSQASQADQYSDFKQSYNTNFHCGEGKITGVIVGGWGWRGLHLEVEWNPNRTPSQLATFTGNNRLVRFLLSDLNAERLKQVTAAAWLAYTNGDYVRFASSHKTAGTNEVDCSRATEIHFTRGK